MNRIAYFSFSVINKEFIKQKQDRQDSYTIFIRMYSSGIQTTSSSHQKKNDPPIEKEEQEEEEEITEEGQEDFEEEDIAKFEKKQRENANQKPTTSQVKFKSNRVAFEDISDNADSKLDQAAFDPEGLFDPHRPPYVEKIQDNKERKAVYDEVGSYIRIVNARKDALASDPFYNFLVLVAGRTNTLLKRLGVEEISDSRRGGGVGGGGGGGTDFTLGGSVTPQKTAGNIFSPMKTTAQGKDTTAKRQKVESASAPLFSPRGAQELAGAYKEIQGITDNTTKTKLKTQLDDAITKSDDIEKRSAYLAWMNKDELVGRAQISELVYASARSMWLRITTRVAPHLSRATFEEFVTDEKMQILFAEIVAYDIETVRFLHATRVQLDKNYTRAIMQLNQSLAELARWSFDENSRTFNPHGRSYRISALHPPGAPRPIASSSFFPVPEFY